MGRSPCCPKEGLNRGAWTAMEDKILAEYIKVHGEGKWRNLPERAGLKRCGKSCRLRWLNYLRPDIKRGNITRDEEELIIRLHNLLGNRWSLIAGRLPGRTDNEIKNYWNTSIGKKFQSASHDPAADTTSCPAKPSSSNKLHKLPPLPPPPPPPPPPSPNKTTQFSGDQKPSKTCSTTSTPNSRVVRTKATRCTKVVLLPQEDPQKPPVLPLDHHHQHDNSSKPAVDAVVNDIYGQMVAGEGQLDYEPLVPFDESNCSQIMALHDLDFETDDKFLSDFLNIDCLDLELSDCFGNVEGHEYDRVIDDHIDIDSDFHDIIISSSSNTNTNKLGCDETLLFSQDMALFGVELQSDTTVSMIDPCDEMDNWLQN